MDSLRSIAILLVLVAHIILGFGAPSSIAPLQLGGIGVDLFFVLSGWLLGGQLFKESKTGSINIKTFWFKRWFRTLPAYYTVLFFTYFQQYITKIDPALPLDYLVFLQNYNYPLEIFSVSWSLAVEEQFYLFIAPFLLLIVKLSKRKQFLILLLLLMLPSVFRYLNLYTHYNETHVRLDGCVAGVLLAFIKQNFDVVWSKMLFHSRKIFFVSLIIFFYLFIQRYYPVIYLGEPSYFLLACVFSVWVIYANSNLSIMDSFKFPFSYYISTRSYAMYLLHPEAIAITNRFFNIDFFVLYMLFVLILTVALSEILYKFVELPFMRLRGKVIS